MSFKSALHGRALSANPRQDHSPEWSWFWRHVTHAVNFSYGTNWDGGIRDFGGYVTGWTKNGATIDPVSVNSPWGKAFGNRSDGFDITGLVAAGPEPAYAGGTHFVFVTDFSSLKGTQGRIIFDAGQERALGIQPSTNVAFIQNREGQLEAVGTTDLSTLDGPFTIGGYLENLVEAEIFVNGVSEDTGTGGANWGNLIPSAFFGSDGSRGFIGDVACCYSFVGYKLTAAQHWQLHNDPHGPFRTNRKPVYKIFMPTVAAGGVTANPTTGSLALAGNAPTPNIAERDTVTPDNDALTLAGQAPVASQQLTASPAVGALALTGQVPSTALGLVASPANDTLALTGNVPDISSSGVISPSNGALDLAGQTPTVDLAERDSVAPDAGTLALAGQAPSILSAGIVTPDADALALTGQTPSVDLAERDTVTPDNDELAIAGQAPTAPVTGENDLLSSPDAGALALTGQVPAANLTQRDTVTPSNGALTTAGQTPTLALAQRDTVSPGADVLSILGLQPSLEESSTLTTTPDAGTLALSGQQPTSTVVLRITASPGVAGLTISGQVPTIPASGVVSAIAGELTITGNTPSVADSATSTLIVSSVQVTSTRTILLNTTSATQLVRSKTRKVLS